MNKKFKKALLIGGGLFIFSEICGTMGEVQAFTCIHKVYPEEIDTVLEGITRKDIKINPYGKAKCKIISKISRFYIDNNII